jgi:hypothetical protein
MREIDMADPAKKNESKLRGKKTRQERSDGKKKSRSMSSNGKLADISVATGVSRPNESDKRSLPPRNDTEVPVENEPVSNTSISTRFICKVCGNLFEDQDLLNEHINDLHAPKRTVTATGIIQNVFEGQLNFPKTKAEIVRYVEENKDKESITPDVIDALRNIPDRRYNDEADFVLGIEQQRNAP